MLDYFGGVPALVVCDNCKQAVIVNQDWIEPELNKDYADWADHYGTVILPAKVRNPKFKSSVENAVGILEKGLFHKLEERQYFSLEQFNQDLWKELETLNKEPFKKKEHNRYYYWEEEKLELMPLPSTHYEYMERRTATVSSDFHVRFDNAYYSVDKAHLHKKVSIKLFEFGEKQRADPVSANATNGFCSSKMFATRFERATFRLGGGRSIQLSYANVLCNLQST